MNTDIQISSSQIGFILQPVFSPTKNTRDTEEQPDTWGLILTPGSSRRLLWLSLPSDTADSSVFTLLWFLGVDVGGDAALWQLLERLVVTWRWNFFVGPNSQNKRSKNSKESSGQWQFLIWATWAQGSTCAWACPPNTLVTTPSPSVHKYPCPPASHPPRSTTS